MTHGETWRLTGMHRRHGDSATQAMEPAVACDALLTLYSERRCSGICCATVSQLYTFPSISAQPEVRTSMENVPSLWETCCTPALSSSIVYAGDGVSVAIRPAFSSRRRSEQWFGARRVVLIATAILAPEECRPPPSAPEARASQERPAGGILAHAAPQDGEALALDSGRGHARYRPGRGASVAPV